MPFKHIRAQNRQPQSHRDVAMAVISYYRPLADFDQSSWLGEVNGSSTRLIITDGYHKESFTGSVRFNHWGDAVTGGTLNGYSYSQGGTLFMSISGLSLSAVTVYGLYTSQRAAELLLLMHAGNDTVKGSQYADVLAGYEGNDTIYGYAGDDQLIGGNGNDLLDGGIGTDTLIGGQGADIYVIDRLPDVIIENTNEGIDQVRVAINTVGGSYTLGANLENAALINKVAFNLVGNGLNNVLLGNAAANRIDGGLGADRMEGGAGNDTYVVDNIGDMIIDTAGIDTVETSIRYTLGNSLENLVLTGNQAISGTGNTLANVLDGSQNSAANELRGLGGKDTYIVGAGDTVFEEANGGIDLVKAHVSYTLGDNLENLSLLGGDNLDATGNALANTLIGNNGNNVLDGGASVDKLIGGKGDDTYIVDLTSKNTLQDSITELTGEGNDTLVLRGGNDSLKASTLKLQLHLENLDASLTGSVRLHLTGNALDNIMTGNDADNILSGEAGNDRLFGGDGDDILIGGIGADILSGGAGNDIFRFTALNHLGLGERNQDVILDFVNGEDTLDFKAFKGYSFKGDGVFDGTKQLRYERVDDALMLYGNSSGDLNPDFSIKLLGVSQLQAGDLLLG